MKIVNASETSRTTRPQPYRRSRGAAPFQRIISKTEEFSELDQPLHLHDKNIIVIIESEGAVFDVYRYWHNTAYLPSFVGCFANSADPAVAGEIWRTIALDSSLRGEHPFIILLAALRVLNMLFPSMQRAAIIKALEKYCLSERSIDDLFKLDEKHSAEMMIIDWFSMAEGLIQEMGRVPHFSIAEEFLRSAKYIAPHSELLVYSSFAEAYAMKMWQSAGLGECFYRIAGKERGKPSDYIQTALSSGFQNSSMVVIGSSTAMFHAAQLAGIRFFPISPGQEEESWRILTEQWFPAFLRGEAWKIDMQALPFYEIMCSEFNVARIASIVQERLGLHKANTNPRNG